MTLQRVSLSLLFVAVLCSAAGDSAPERTTLTRRLLASSASNNANNPMPSPTVGPPTPPPTFSQSCVASCNYILAISVGLIPPPQEWINDTYSTEFLNTRTEPVTGRDAWSNPSAITSWNVWGLAANIVAAITQAQGVADFGSAILDIYYKRPFQWREFSDSNLKANFDPKALKKKTFFAFSSFQEAWSFGSTTCECVTTSDGFVDFQDRIFRASEYPGTDASLLFDGFQYVIGTREVFPQFDGSQGAIGSGLMFISTHQPFAYGFESFTGDPSNDLADIISVKGMLWAFWRNKDKSKGVLGVTTHYGTVFGQTPDLDMLVQKLALKFSPEVGSLDVYVLGDFNTNSVQLRDESIVLSNMSFLTNGTGGTDISRTTSNAAIDHIWGGTYDADSDVLFGPLDGVKTSGVNVQIPGWVVGQTDPPPGPFVPNPFSDLSDHTLLMAIIEDDSDSSSS